MDDQGAAVKRIRDGGYEKEKFFSASSTDAGYVAVDGGGWALEPWTNQVGISDRWFTSGSESVFGSSPPMGGHFQYSNGRFYDEEAGCFPKNRAEAGAGAVDESGRNLQSLVYFGQRERLWHFAADGRPFPIYSNSASCSAARSSAHWSRVARCAGK